MRAEPTPALGLRAAAHQRAIKGTKLSCERTCDQELTNASGTQKTAFPPFDRCGVHADSVATSVGVVANRAAILARSAYISGSGLYTLS